MAATALLALVLLGSPAAPALGATAAPPPQGCTPTPLAAAIAASGTVCVHHLLVTHTVNTQEQNHTTFTVTDQSEKDKCVITDEEGSVVSVGVLPTQGQNAQALQETESACDTGTLTQHLH